MVKQLYTSITDNFARLTMLEELDPALLYLPYVCYNC